VGQIAEGGKVSRHKAAQAVDVAKHVPELLDEVISGKRPLPEAAKKAQERKPTKPRQHGYASNSRNTLCRSCRV
jgi:hypothetical protein